MANNKKYMITFEKTLKTSFLQMLFNLKNLIRQFEGEN